MSYTLEDTLEGLKDTEKDRQMEIERLLDTVSNNAVALDKTRNPEAIRKKQHKLVECLLQEISDSNIPKDYPIPKTEDIEVEALTELEEEIQLAGKLLDKMKKDLADIKEDITYLETKKTGLEKMKQAFLDTTTMTIRTTYSEELAIAKRIFQTVKKDLSLTTEILFPENQKFQQFLAKLTAAYTKGGDDLYLEVTSEIEDLVNFLFEADIVVYHRNDRKRVRFADML